MFLLHCIHLGSNSTWPLPSAKRVPQSVSHLLRVWLQRYMRGIIAEMIRALQQAATVTVSPGPTIALRLDRKLTHGQNKQSIDMLWIFTWSELIGFWKSRCGCCASLDLMRLVIEDALALALLWFELVAVLVPHTLIWVQLRKALPFGDITEIHL